MDKGYVKSFFAIAVVAALVAVAFPIGAVAASTDVDGAWTAEGTRWDAEPTIVTPSDTDRFLQIWTARFLDSPTLEAYLNSPGLYEDGFNGLPESDKAWLVVQLLQHWERTFPAFGKDVWTGEAAQDQEKFEELSTLVYATIFAKDEFFGALRESFPNSEIAPPSMEAQDAGHAEFPGLTQEGIDAQFDAIHDAARIISDAPAGDDISLPDPLAPESLVTVNAPTAPELTSLAGVATPIDAPVIDVAEPTPVVLPPLERRAVAPPETPDVPEVPDAPDVPSTIDGILAQAEALVEDLQNINAEELAPTLLNLVETGTYIACGQLVDGALTCSLTPVALGTPVLLDLDSDALTGVAGAEVVAHLSPTVDPEFTPNGLSASLEVRRTEPSALPTSAPLPAIVFVVYRLAPAGLQIVAGFDGRTDTLADVQGARATVKDVTLALAGDVRLRAVMTHEGPTNSIALVAGVATVDPATFPVMVTDPTIASILFEPAPVSLQVDLRFANEGGEDIIEGSVLSSEVTTVTASITMDHGDSHREMVATIEDLPTELEFRVVSQALGAVHLNYDANAPFPRFALTDLLVPDVNDPSTFSTLSAEVLDIPSSITFDIERPFNVMYSASGRVGEATIFLQENRTNIYQVAVYGHLEGLPSVWSIDGIASPLTVEYRADGEVDVLDFWMYESTDDTTMSAHIEGIPDAIDLLVDDGHVVFTAGQPIDLVEAYFTTGGVAAPVLSGEFAAYKSDGAGMGASTRLAGLTSIELDTRDATATHANVQIAGGEPFTIRVDDVRIYADAYLSNLPTEIDVTLTPSSFTYDLAQPVTAINVYAEMQDLLAYVAVNDLPNELTVAWTPTGLTWDANAAITSVFVDLEKGNLRLQTLVTSIPADFTVGWGDGVATFSTPTALGSIWVLAQINGGALGSLAGDHFVVNQAGSAIGLSLKLSGIKAVSADSRNGGAYALTLSPGGQPFQIVANLDALDAAAYVSNLPQSIAVDLNPAASSFGYGANQPITQIWAYASFTNGRIAYVSLNDLPASVDVSWTLGSTPVVTYVASSSAGAITAYLQESNGAVFSANIASLPPYIRLSISSNDFLVDARSSASAGAGTGTIGTITANYGSDGNTLGGSGNHANLYQRSALTRASFSYSGLQLARVYMVSDNLYIDIVNSAPRYFTAYADTDEAYLSLSINNIPAHVRVTGSGTQFTYNAYGATVNEIAAYFNDREGLAASISIRDIPGYAVLNLNLPATTISYSASSAISGIDVDVWKDAWYGKLRLVSIPTSWTATFGSGTYRFDAPNGIGSVQAIVTNHGSWSTLSGNHLNVKYVQGVGRSAVDTIDASLLMTQVKRAEYRTVGTNNFIDLQMGGGGNFAARGDLTFSNGVLAYLYTTFTPLPASIQATIGEATYITNSANFDFYAYVHYGNSAALAATPNPGSTHGLKVRDGASGSNRAVKATLYLTGLPTSVWIDSRNDAFGFTNWRPSYNYLLVDIELDNFLSTPIDAYAFMDGLSTTAPTSLSYNMDVVSGSTKTTRVDFVTTRPLGRLYADANIGNNHGRIDISNIPDDIHATFTVANGVTTFAWDATAAISSIYAGFRIPTQSASFQGYISFTDIPSDFSISLGRAGGGQGPTVTYNANANTLDLSAFVDASLFGGDLRARLSFGFTNLGRDVDVYLSGSGLRFTSTPATGSLYANVWGSYNYYKSGSGVWDAGGFLEYPWAYHIGVNPNVNNLGVTLTSFSDFSLQWGVTSKLAGSYNSFSFGWDSMSVGLDLYGKVQIRVDWPWPFGSSTIDLVNYHTHQTIPVNVLFHKYTNHQSTWFGVSGHVICDYSLSTTIRPHPHGATWNAVSTTSATASGGAWYVVPNPYGFVPSWAVDLVARYTSPDGGSGPGLSFSYDCF